MVLFYCNIGKKKNIIYTLAHGFKTKAMEDSQARFEKFCEFFSSYTAFKGYILEGEEVVPCNNILKWSKWMEENWKNRIVRSTKIRESRVSTVFLGMDHGIMMGEPPLYFETMVFGGRHNQYMQRYTTYQQALKGHETVCRMVVED